MKIIFLTHYFYPHIGGVEKHVLQISKQLTKQHHQITIITSKYDPTLSLSSQYQDIQIIRIPNIDNWIRPNKKTIWHWIIKHQKLFQNADIIHCHDVFFWYLPLRLLIPQKPVFTTFHGYEGKYPPSTKAIVIRKISEKLSYDHICVGKYLSKWYHTNCHNITYGATTTPSRLAPPRSNNTAIFIGRFSPDTGINSYLKAIDILNAKKIKLNLEFCGGGPLEKKISQYGKLLGYQTDISAPLKRNRFAFVSGYLTIMEAMAHQRLVFATYDNPLKKDYLQMTPFKDLINIASNPKQLAQQIQYYIKHPDKEKLKIKSAYHWVQSQTWEKLTHQYQQLWKNQTSV